VLAALLCVTGCVGAIDRTPRQSQATSGEAYIPVADLGDASRYWNTDWRGRSSELYGEVVALTTTYSQTTRYVFGETDCNDMVIDAWQELLARRIRSVIVVGNLERFHESFLACNHAWLMVYSGKGSAAALDLVGGKVHVWEDVRSDPRLVQYWEGFVYENPADLRADFRERW
jgi:hypothetical protein